MRSGGELTLLVSFPDYDVRVDVAVDEPRVRGAPHGPADAHEAVLDRGREDGRVGLAATVSARAAEMDGEEATHACFEV